MKMKLYRAGTVSNWVLTKCEEPDEEKNADKYQWSSNPSHYDDQQIAQYNSKNKSTVT